MAVQESIALLASCTTAEELAETTWLHGIVKLLDVGPTERAQMTALECCAWFRLKRRHELLTAGINPSADLVDGESKFVGLLDVGSPCVHASVTLHRPWRRW